jgi:hypothetical protein
VDPDVTPTFTGLAATRVDELPAVGKEGRTAAMGPLAPFADRLAP